jgi:hypothetical protein
VKDGKKGLFIGHDSSRTGAPLLLLLELIKWLTSNSSIKPSVLLKQRGELEAEYEMATPTRNLVKEFEKIDCGFHRRILRKTRFLTRRKMDLRRRNGAVMRHDMVFRKAFVSMALSMALSASILALSLIIRISCMRLSS